MRQRRISKKLLLTGALFITVFAASSVSGQTPSTVNICETLPLQPAEREMGGAKVDCYNFDLQKEYFFRVHVEQKCVDVALKLSDSKGRVILEVDSPNGIQGPELLSIIVPETDSYKLEIKAGLGNGRYSIVQEALRPPTEDDRKQIAAQTFIAQAQTTAAASPPAALSLLQKAGDLFRESGDKHGEARAFFEAGYLANAVGDKDSALSFYERALTLYEGIPDQLEEARTLTTIGAVHFASGDNREAVNYFQRADLLLKDACPLDRADALQGLGKSYLRLSEWEQSLESFNKALRLFRDIPYPSGVAQTLANIGVVQLELSQKQEALRNFEQAWDIVKDASLREDEAAVLSNIGRAYDDMGRIEEAREKFELALSKTEDKQAKASITLSIGKSFLDQGNSQKALESYEAARQMFKEVGDIYGEINAINSVGLAHSQSGNKKKALEYYNLALLFFRNFGSKRGEAITFGNLMSGWQSLGNRRLAIFFGKQSVNLFQQIRDTARRIDDESLRSFTATVESTYRTLAALLLEENRIAEAQEVLGLLKQEEFSRFMQPSQNQPSNPVRQISLNKEEEDAALRYKTFEDDFTLLTKHTVDLEREKALLKQQGQTLPTEKQADIQKQQDDLNERFKKFLQDLAEDFSSPKAETKLEVSPTLTHVWQKRLAELGNGTVLVTTLLTEDHYYLILTTPTSQIARSKKIRRKDITHRVDVLRLALRDTRTLDDYLPLTKELYQILVAPIAIDLQRLSAKTLLLSLDGELRYVPFAVLHDGQSFLVEKYATVVVTLAQPPDNKRVSPETWRALGVGVSKGIGNNPPLPRVLCELRSVVADKTMKSCGRAGLFPGRILLDKRFTRVNFAAALKQKPQLVHVATHFQLGSENDVNSYLFFGDGDRLRLVELRHNKGNQFDLSDVDLLTLSACDTGAKETNDANGVEIENLGVIAQRRGAKAVMASLWYIPDNRTPVLMEEFYRRYKDGKGVTAKAEALRQAQIKMLKQSEDILNFKYLHPAYWGAFIVLGNL
jgi:CHAT domain-containing protein